MITMPFKRGMSLIPQNNQHFNFLATGISKQSHSVLVVKFQSKIQKSETLRDSRERKFQQISAESKGGYKQALDLCSFTEIYFASTDEKSFSSFVCSTEMDGTRSVKCNRDLTNNSKY